MKYERFTELWDALITNRPMRIDNRVPIIDTMSPNTSIALIKYANGDKSDFDKVRDFLKKRI